MNTSDNEYDDDYDDALDAYDVNPSKARAGGGSTNRPFHSGKGTRAKEATSARNTVRVQINASSKEQKKNSKK